MATSSEYLEKYKRYSKLLEKALEYFEKLLESEGKGVKAFKYETPQMNSWAEYTDAGDFLKKVVTPLEKLTSFYKSRINNPKGPILRYGTKRRVF